MSGPDSTAEPQRIAELFAEALERPPHERRAFLDHQCSGSTALLAEVDSLLAAHEEAAEFLEPLDGPRSAALLVEALEEEVRTPRAGPYRLVRELGRGGMGIVYLAERVEGGFEQRAAVKLVRRGMDTDAILRRFVRERQILASLEHPNVARLLDGGATEDGQPYFAMEYVDGEPLEEYCDLRRLGIEGRLRLFETAVRAVQYAHSKLVVHRDLKPSNILITREGQLKLLDFGVAKLLVDEEGDSAAAALTQAEGHPMTVAYAAPEQVRGEAVTTVTDVYSLGVVLYELLSGVRPYGAEGRTPDVLARAVCEHEPQPPSVAAKAEGAARARGLTPERLARRLRGDLDTIALKALAKDPGRRYAAAESLAEDVRRHLAGHPVLARRDTVGYRAAKFARRHKVAVAATAAAAVSLMLGLLGTAWQAQRARREAERALAVQRFLVGVFERADPTRSLGETVTAHQLLDEGARRLRSGSAADASTRAELADTLARTYRSLGQLDEAANWSGEAVAGFRASLGTGHPRAALAELTQAEIRADRGDVKAARAALDVLLPRLRDGYGDGSPEHLRTRSAQAALLAQSGESEGALSEERDILAATQRAFGGDSIEAAVQQGRVAEALATLSRYAEAEAAFRDALRRLERAGATRSPQSVHLETELADLLDRAGSDEEADARFRSALEKARGVLGPRHPQFAQILIKYGFLHNEQGRYEEGEAALVEAISILEPLGHYDAGAALRYQGFSLLRRERLAEARDDFARAERIFRAKLGDDHPLTWHAVVTVAYTSGRLGGLAEAETRLRAAIAALERLHGAESDDVRVPKSYLGEILRMAGHFEEAEALHRWALDLARRLHGGDDKPAAAAAKNQLALDLLEAGRPERLAEARRFADESLSFLRGRPSEPARLGDVLATSGRIAAAQRDFARARRELAEAVERLSAARSDDAPSTRVARRALAALRPP